MNANAFLQKDYENDTTLRPQKNKPKQTQFQIGSQMSDVRSQKPDYLLSVLCFLMQPKLLNFHHKNSLTVGPNSVKYLFLCNERECFYEKLYGKERKRRA